MGRKVTSAFETSMSSIQRGESLKFGTDSNFRKTGMLKGKSLSRSARASWQVQRVCLSFNLKCVMVLGKWTKIDL